MNSQAIDTNILCVLKGLEQAVESANFFALELVLKSLEENFAGDAGGLESNVGDIANRAAHATEEFERLVRKLQAA